MAYIYVKRDGERVETHVAAAFDRLEKAFTRAFPGLGLIVASGTRTRAEQAELYRLWQAGRGNLAAAPGYSNHEESGPAGPRALDVWDTGRDAGVTVAGTKRANWLRANAPEYGFSPAGYGFARVEPWHIEYTGPLSGGGVKHVTVSRPVKDIQKLVGAKPDGIWGPETESKVKAWQKAHGLTADGIWGPASDAKGFPKKPVKPKPVKADPLIRKVQQKLKTNYPLYAGKLVVDGINGPKTIAAVKEFQRRSGLVVDGIVGPKTRKALGL